MRTNVQQITNTNFGKQKIWHNEHCAWVSIPKNANTVFRKICACAGMRKLAVTESAHSKETFCIMRDPYTRVISGLGEYKQRRNKQTFTVEQLLLQLYNDPAPFDEHLETQVFYMQGHTFDHILKFEDLYEETRKIKYFSENAEHRHWVTKFLSMDKTTTSRHFTKKSLTTIVNENYDLLTAIVNKYYAIDNDIWHNRHLFQNRKIRKEIF